MTTRVALTALIDVATSSTPDARAMKRATQGLTDIFTGMHIGPRDQANTDRTAPGDVAQDSAFAALLAAFGPAAADDD